MKINSTQSKIIDFVSNNPNCDAKEIANGTKLKSDVVATSIKKLLEIGTIIRKEKGKKLSYTSQTISPIDETPVVDETPVTEISKEKESAAVTPKEKTKSAGRDLTKYKFNGGEYGKGPLVLAVVKKFVEDKPKTTIQNLAKAFPPELLFRFGIFQEMKEAHKISNGRPRYSLKPEQTIKLKDGKSIAVCNQFTSETIKPFLKAAKENGYSIR